MSHLISEWTELHSRTSHQLGFCWVMFFCGSKTPRGFSPEPWWCKLKEGLHHSSSVFISVGTYRSHVTTAENGKRIGSDLFRTDQSLQKSEEKVSNICWPFHKWGFVQGRSGPVRFWGLRTVICNIICRPCGPVLVIFSSHWTRTSGSERDSVDLLVLHNQRSRFRHPEGLSWSGTSWVWTSLIKLLS